MSQLQVVGDRGGNTSLRQHRNPKLKPGLQDRIAHNVYVLSSKKFTVVPENEHLIPTWPALHGL